MPERQKNLLFGHKSFTEIGAWEFRDRRGGYSGSPFLAETRENLDGLGKIHSSHFCGKRRW